MTKQEAEQAVLQVFQQQKSKWAEVLVSDRSLTVWEGTAGGWIIILCMLRSDRKCCSATASFPAKEILISLSTGTADSLREEFIGR